jgi:hypothetical protein
VIALDMNFIRELGNRLWPSIARNLAIIFISLGLLAIIWGIALADQEPAFLSQVLLAFGNSIIVGGVFTALLRTAVFLDIFLNSIQRVLYADDLIGDHQDIEKIWRKITRHVGAKRFPELEESFSKAVLEHYFTSKRNFYYKYMSREIVVTGLDEERGMIELEEATMADIVPFEETEHIIYRFTYSYSKGGNRVVTSHTLNGEDIGRYNNQLEVKSDSDQNYIEEIRKLPSKTYRMERKAKVSIPLHGRRYLKYIFNTYIKKCRIKATSEIDEIELHFEPIAFPDGFSDHNQINNYPRRQLDKVSEEIMMPEQGYMVTFIDNR